MPGVTNIEMFLGGYSPEVKELTLAARNFLVAALPGAQETVDVVSKVVGYGYGPGYKGLVCTLILSKKGVKLGIAHGAGLPDPKRLMQGKGKVHRYVPLQTTSDLMQPGLKSLLQAAVTAWKERHRHL